MNQELQPYEVSMTIGDIANGYAASNAFAAYQERKSKNTLRRQKADIALFASYLAQAGLQIEAEGLFMTASAWSGITYGLVEGFVRWLVQTGYAVGSINVRLSTIKGYCAVAAKAGVLSSSEIGLIKLVKGYRHKEGRNLDETRETTRVGHKKADAVIIDVKQAALLKKQPDTAQGRRDALLLCLLLEHGLRCGEIADLSVASIDLAQGTLSFYRKKVDLTQTHELTRATWIAATRYLEVAKSAPTDSLLMGSRKGGSLQGRMSERAITARVEMLCKAIGLEGASAHDGRHAWATFAVRGGTDLKTLQDAGGWKSIAMPARYADSAKIANRGVKLQTAESEG